MILVSSIISSYETKWPKFCVLNCSLSLVPRKILQNDGSSVPSSQFFSPFQVRVHETHPPSAQENLSFEQLIPEGKWMKLNVKTKNRYPMRTSVGFAAFLKKSTTLASHPLCLSQYSSPTLSIVLFIWLSVFLLRLGIPPLDCFQRNLPRPTVNF